MAYVCGECNVEFGSSQSLNAHARKHRGYTSDQLRAPCCSVLTRKVVNISILDRHDAAWIANGKTCQNCGSRFVSRENDYCSRRCAAILNNARVPRRRGPLPKPRMPRKYRRWREDVVGEFTRVFYNECAKTGRFFWAISRRKYHPDAYSNRAEYARACRFKFAVSQHPELFDLSLIERLGWYSTPGSRRGVRNLEGVSRDHLLSIDDGWKQHVPPRIMRHPANCRLISHRENQRKSRRSLITLAELMARIEA